MKELNWVKELNESYLQEIANTDPYMNFTSVLRRGMLNHMRTITNHGKILEKAPNHIDDFISFQYPKHEFDAMMQQQPSAPVEHIAHAAVHLHTGDFVDHVAEREEVDLFNHDENSSGDSEDSGDHWE